MKRIEWDEPRIDIAEEIKARVSMYDIVTRYTGQPVQNRIQCPFHHGHDRNMAIYRNGYKCYVCGETGDQIGYMQKLFGLDYFGAAERLDRDFGLGLPLGERRGEIDPALLREARERAWRRSLQALEEREREEDLALLWDVWCLCDRALREDDPRSERYAAAARWIGYVGYLIDVCEEEEWSIKAASRQAMM